MALTLLAVVLLLPSLVVPNARAARDDGKRARVTDSILGVRVGAELKDVHAKLKSLGTVAGRDTDEGGRKEVWTFKKTDFASLVYETNREGRVEWVTAFVRAGREIPFEKLGDLSAARVKTDNRVSWSVEGKEGREGEEGEEGEGYALTARGSGGKAGVIHLVALDFVER